MGNQIQFDYYYGVEAEQFSFYRVPRLLIKDERFKGLSSDAKLLYGLMLDRMGLSMKNGWLDDENRAYIIYTIEDIMEDLGCAKGTCVKVLKELDSENGIGLIEKKRRGLGKPDIIYVKNFATVGEKKEKEQGTADGKEPANPDISTEVQNLNFKKSKNCTSRSSEIGLPEVQKVDSNYTEQNYTDRNYTNPIYQSTEEPDGEENHASGYIPVQKSDRIDVMDTANAYMELIKNNLGYDYYMTYASANDKELFEEIYHTVCDVVCVKKDFVRINGDNYPYELVKGRFLKLNQSHVEYVLGCLKETTTKITNIRAYLITTLYNAPATINTYYQQLVQHDMYGGGWHEKGIV